MNFFSGPKYGSFGTSWLQVRLYPDDHAAWFRIFGYGFRIVDHRLNPPLFSERNAGRFGQRKRYYWHLGPWCLMALSRGGGETGSTRPA